jgi:glucose dehydrogenase
LLNDGRETDNVVTYGMGYDLRRHIPLRQIDTANVKRLVPVWSTTLSNLLGEHAQPLVYTGVMYVTNAAWMFAIDLATGKQIWRTPVGNCPPRSNGTIQSLTNNANTRIAQLALAQILVQYAGGYASSIAPGWRNWQTRQI